MQTTPIPDYYEILGVERNAGPEQIRSAWRSAAHLSHPDTGGSNGLFRLLTVAYETLSDPAKRSAYDAFLSSPTHDQPEDEREYDGYDQEGEEQSDEADEWDVVDEDEPVDNRPQTEHASNDTETKSDFRRIGPFRLHHVALIVMFAIYAACRTIISQADAQSLDMWLLGAGIVIVLWRLSVLIGRSKAQSEAAYRQSGVDEVDTMEGVEFEQRLARLFVDLGYQVETTVTTGDYGADLILHSDEGCVVVQAKRSSRAVGVAAVQEAHTAMAHYGAQRAIVVTNNRFTRQAAVLADDAGVTLYDRTWLVESMASAVEALGTRLTSKRRLERTALRYGAPVLAKVVFYTLVIPFGLALWVIGSVIGGAAKLSQPLQRGS